jgi:hypothetical protein
VCVNLKGAYLSLVLAAKERLFLSNAGCVSGLARILVAFRDRLSRIYGLIVMLVADITHLR